MSGILNEKYMRDDSMEQNNSAAKCIWNRRRHQYSDCIIDMNIAILPLIIKIQILLYFYYKYT